MMGTFVSSVKSLSRKSEMIGGIFWPTDIYIQREGKPPPPADIRAHLHNGKRMKGVYRCEDTHGNPAGCFRVSGVSSEDGA